MTKTSEIRIPRTTAMFVTNLSQILREDFGLRVTVHEQWTFVKVASWEECLQKGECHPHGTSEEFEARKEANPDDQSLWWADCHYPYKIDVYLAEGSLRAGADAVEVRVRITATQNDAFGDMFEAEVWVKVGECPIQSGSFWLDMPLDHMSLRRDEPMPDYPPDRIAFWRKEVPKRSKFELKDGRVQAVQPPEQTTREKRIARQKLLTEANN